MIKFDIGNDNLPYAIFADEHDAVDYMTDNKIETKTACWGGYHNAVLLSYTIGL